MYRHPKTEKSIRNNLMVRSISVHQLCLNFRLICNRSSTEARGPQEGCITYRNHTQYWCSEAQGSRFLQWYRTCHKKLFQNHMRSDTTACPPAAQAPVWVSGFIKTADIKLAAMSVQLCLKTPWQKKVSTNEVGYGSGYGPALSSRCSLLQSQKQMHSRLSLKARWKTDSAF